MHAECAGVSGPGYYAAGPQLDVQDVPAKLQPSHTSCGHGWLSNPKAALASTEAEVRDEASAPLFHARGMTFADLHITALLVAVIPSYVVAVELRHADPPTTGTEASECQGEHLTSLNS